MNEIAFRVAREAMGEAPPEKPGWKNPAALELGRLGGAKGGKARAAKLFADEKSEIARHAALVRWRKRES